MTLSKSFSQYQVVVFLGVFCFFFNWTVDYLKVFEIVGLIIRGFEKIV